MCADVAERVGEARDGIDRRARREDGVEGRQLDVGVGGTDVDVATVCNVGSGEGISDTGAGGVDVDVASEGHEAERAGRPSFGSTTSMKVFRTWTASSHRAGAAGPRPLRRPAHAVRLDEHAVVAGTCSHVGLPLADAALLCV